MKRLCGFLALLLALLLAAAPVLAATGGEESAPKTLDFSQRLAAAGKLLGMFLLVMAVLYGVLLLSRKIAAWIDKHKT